MKYKVAFTFDDGYGGEYPITATVEIVGEEATVLEMDGLTDRDGGEIPRLQAEADEAAIAAAHKYLALRGELSDWLGNGPDEWVAPSQEWVAERSRLEAEIAKLEA